MPPRGMDLRAAAKAALRFRDARRWKQFHTPANLAKGLAVEAAELLEHFTWTRDASEERAAARAKREAIADELADVTVFVIYLCAALEIDLAAAVRAKLAKNARKYPVAKARGSAKKYSEL